jgi:hypothetical protein
MKRLLSMLSLLIGLTLAVVTVAQAYEDPGSDQIAVRDPLAEILQSPQTALQVGTADMKIEAGGPESTSVKREMAFLGLISAPTQDVNKE